MADMNDSISPDALRPPEPEVVSGLLAVGDGHHMYYEQWGFAAGLPVVFLHGGPGGGCSPR